MPGRIGDAIQHLAAAGNGAPGGMAVRDKIRLPAFQMAGCAGWRLSGSPDFRSASLPKIASGYLMCSFDTFSSAFLDARTQAIPVFCDKAL